LGQRSFKGQNYAGICPIVTYLWCHSRTAPLHYYCYYYY